MTCSLRASSSSCAGALTPESSPPARRWGRSAGGPSARTHDTTHIRHSRDSETNSPSENLCSHSGFSNLRSSPRSGSGHGSLLLTLGTKPGSTRFSHTSLQTTPDRCAEAWMCARQEKRCSGFTVSSWGGKNIGDKALESRAFPPEEEDKAPSSSLPGPTLVVQPCQGAFLLWETDNLLQEKHLAKCSGGCETRYHGFLDQHGFAPSMPNPSPQHLALPPRVLLPLPGRHGSLWRLILSVQPLRHQGRRSIHHTHGLLSTENKILSAHLFCRDSPLRAELVFKGFSTVSHCWRDV